MKTLWQSSREAGLFGAATLVVLVLSGGMPAAAAGDEVDVSKDVENLRQDMAHKFDENLDEVRDLFQEFRENLLQRYEQEIGDLEQEMNRVAGRLEQELNAQLADITARFEALLKEMDSAVDAAAIEEATGALTGEIGELRKEVQSLSKTTAGFFQNGEDKENEDEEPGEY